MRSGAAAEAAAGADRPAHAVGSCGPAALPMLAVAASGPSTTWTGRASPSIVTAANPLWITVAAALYLGAVFAMAGRWRAVLQPARARW